MKNEIENLWYSYLCEKPVIRTDDEKSLIKKFSSAEKDFLSSLNAEQKIKFNIYDDILLELNHISEKNAFIKGVNFTTRFFIETSRD